MNVLHDGCQLGIAAAIILQTPDTEVAYTKAGREEQRERERGGGMGERNVTGIRLVANDFCDCRLAASVPA